MSGRIIGYLPVPALVIDSVPVIPEAVVDLSYRATIDRRSYRHRISCVSEEAREGLRFALARLDVLRTPTLETELAQAVGQKINKARVHKRNPLVAQLTLEDGTVMELLMKPGSPPPSPVARSPGRPVAFPRSRSGQPVHRHRLPVPAQQHRSKPRSNGTQRAEPGPEGPLGQHRMPRRSSPSSVRWKE
jgi:hypothetical protein